MALDSGGAAQLAAEETALLERFKHNAAPAAAKVQALVSAA